MGEESTGGRKETVERMLKEKRVREGQEMLEEILKEGRKWKKGNVHNGGRKKMMGGKNT